MRRTPRITIGRIMIGVATVAVLFGLLPHHPGSIVLVAFVGISVAGFVLSKPSYEAGPSYLEGNPGPRPVRPRRYQFSIWQVMALAVYAAGCSLWAKLDPLAGAMAFVLFGVAGLWIIFIAMGRSDHGPGG